jgi:hypothetical protein
MQEGVSPLCPLKVRRLFRVECRRHGEAEAIARVVQRIEGAQGRQAPILHRDGLADCRSRANQLFMMPNSMNSATP